MSVFEFLQDKSKPIVRPVSVGGFTPGPVESKPLDLSIGRLNSGADRAAVGYGSGVLSGIPSYGADVQPFQTAPKPKTVDQGVIDMNLRPDYGAQMSRFDPVMAQLEAQRQQMMARRDAAIQAAGRGAGAGYNAAIARINDEIGKLQGQLPRVTDLFGQKIQNQYDIYNRAGKELETSYDPALEELDAINKVQNENLRLTFSEAQSGAESVLNKIGADENTRIAVAQEVGRLEESIIEMDEINAAGIRGIMEAAEKLAVTSAVAAGATNALDLKRKQIEVESDFKEKLQNLIADREQQVKARNAAVSAARQLEAARWPEDQPLNRQGFQVVATDQYFKDKNIPEPMQQFAGQLASAGVSGNDLRFIRMNSPNGTPNERAIQRLAQFGLPGDFLSTLPPTYFSKLGVLSGALDTYSRAAQDYDASFVGADPRNFELNSAARAMAGQQWFLDQGHSEKDAFFFGREAAETPNDKLAWIGDFQTTTKTTTRRKFG